MSSVRSRHVAFCHFAAALLALAAPIAGAATQSEAAAPPAATAPGQPQQEESVWHEKILVTATRAPHEAGTLPLYSSVIEATEIRSAPDSGLLDLLRQTPSINLSRDIGNLVAQGRDQGISFRGIIGSTQSRALPLVDGLPIVDPFEGFVQFSMVPKELVERVEVVRGGGSSAWGNLALSGVVNMITRAPTSRELGTMARLGDRATADLNVFYTDVGRRWSGWIAGNHFDTDGYVVVHPDDRGPIDEAKFRRYDSLHGRLGFSASASTAWTLRTMVYDDYHGHGLPTDRDRNKEASASLTLDQLLSPERSWKLQLFHRAIHLESVSGMVDDERTAVVPERDIYSQPARSTGLSASWSVALARHALTVGVDLIEDAVEQQQNVAWDGTSYTKRYDIRGQQRFAGAFVQDSVTLSERTSLQLGTRFDYAWSGDASSVRSALPTGEVTGSDPIADHSVTAFDPSLGVVFAPSATTRLRGAAYTGFRYGTPTELFVGSSGGGRSVTMPNSELAPERLVGGELGVDYTPSRRTALRLTGFYNEVKDLMQRILVGTTGAEGGVLEPCGALPPKSRCLQRRNVGRIRSTGLELGADYRPAERWRLVLDATLMRSRVIENSSDPALEGNQVERAPDEQVSATVEYREPRLGSFYLRGRYVSDAWDDAENTEFLTAHTLVDLGWSRDLRGGWQLFAGVENLFDNRYINRWTPDNREVSGPRLVHAGFRFRTGADRS